jgi:Pyridoxal-dependent decarboxylase conserved domain
VDDRRRLRPDELDRALERLEAAGELPLALVATAGTTDFGSIDPLPALAERARARGLWLHVDAAWGGGLLFSDRHRGLLARIEAADSVTVDFHKLLWQPADCGAFLVRDRALLAPLELTIPYPTPTRRPASPTAGGCPTWSAGRWPPPALRRPGAAAQLRRRRPAGHEELVDAPLSWPPWPRPRSRASRGCAWPPGRSWGRCCSAPSPRPTTRRCRTG